VSTRVAKDGAEVSLRRMSAADVMVIYEWQCLPDTRRFARNPQPPELEGHKKWFTARLASRDCILIMILHDGEPAGILRFDRKPDDDGMLMWLAIIRAIEHLQAKTPAGDEALH